MLETQFEIALREHLFLSKKKPVVDDGLPPIHKLVKFEDNNYVTQLLWRWRN